MLVWHINSSISSRIEVSQPPIQKKYETVCHLHSDSLAQVLLSLNNILNLTCLVRFETKALRDICFYGCCINPFLCIYVCVHFVSEREIHCVIWRLHYRLAMNSIQHLARLLQQSDDGPAPALVTYLEVSCCSLFTNCGIWVAFCLQKV